MTFSCKLTFGNVMANIFTPGYVKWDGKKFVIDSSIKIIGPAGDQGDQGPQGVQGIQGIQGEQGVQGEIGDSEIVFSEDLSGDGYSQTVIGLYGNLITSGVTVGADQDGYSLIWSESDGYWNIVPSFLASVDLSGTAFNQIVSGIRGKLLSPDIGSVGVEQDGYGLAWNATDGYWEPRLAFIASGDISGTPITQTVIGIRNKTLSSNLASIGAGQDGYILTWSFSDAYWKENNISNLLIISGDLSGTNTNQIVSKIRGKTLSSNLASVGAEQDGYILTWSNSDAYWKENSVSSLLTIAGDLSGTSTNQTIVNLQGKTLSTTLASVDAQQDGYILTWSNSDAYWKAVNPSTKVTIAGDLSGTSTNQTLSKIRGKSLSSGLSSLSSSEHRYALAWISGSNYWGAYSQPSEILVWGAGELSITGGPGYLTKYFYPGYNVSAASAAALSFTSPRSGVIKNMWVRHNVTSADTNTISYYVLKNDIATALYVQINGTNSSGSNTTNYVNIDVGDTIGVMAYYNALATSPTKITISVEFTG